VFVSYHQADLAWVQGELLPRLEEAGLKVAIDYRDFEIGVSRLVNIERAVDGSRHTLIVLTPDWVADAWSEFEGLLVSTADPAGRQRKLIPLLLKPSRLPPRIATLTCADFTQVGDRPWRWEQLIAALRDATARGETRFRQENGFQENGFLNAFVDREEELLSLRPERLRARRSPYTLISAPVGYGKSYLLCHLVRVSQADEGTRREWYVCHVDFGTQAGDAIGHVLRSLGMPEGGPSPSGPLSQSWARGEEDVPVDLVCRYVIQELAAPLADGHRVGRRAVLLMFDAVELLCASAQRWLCELLHALYERTRSGPAGGMRADQSDALIRSIRQEIITVRVVLAGRNAERFWEAYECAFAPLPAPQRIRLAPFTLRPIQELIWSQARATQVDLDDQTVVDLAEEVAYLSGGYPAVVRGLVDDLANQSFAVGPAATYFARSRERLVREVLSPVVDSLLDSLELESGVEPAQRIEPRITRITRIEQRILREAVRTLSVFRRVNANTVQALAQAGMLNSLRLPDASGLLAEQVPAERVPVDEVQLLGTLQRAHLLEGPTIQEPFYHDRTIRRVLALDMAYRSPEGHVRYRQLNRIARDLYAGWIHNLGKALPDSQLKSVQRILSVVEWLFHALQDPDVDDETLRVGLQAHVRVLPGGEQVTPTAELIAAEIARDAELCYLLRRRLGEGGQTDGVSAVMGWLAELVPGEI
jgi:hypothetical protein